MIKDMTIKNRISIQEARAEMAAQETNKKKFRFSEFPFLNEVTENTWENSYPNIKTPTKDNSNISKKLFTQVINKSPAKDRTPTENKIKIFKENILFTQSPPSALTSSQKKINYQKSEQNNAVVTNNNRNHLKSLLEITKAIKNIMQNYQGCQE